MSSVEEFFAASKREGAIAFVDDTALAQIAGVDAVAISTLHGPLIAICEGPLSTAIHWLKTHPSLRHIVSASTLEQPWARVHFEHVAATLGNDKKPRLLDWVTSMSGRRVRLTHSNKRIERLDRMDAYLESKGVSQRTREAARDVAEELLTNAFYDAPVAAGMVHQPISRTQEVSLNDAGACDLAYGCKGDMVMVRVRDPFGALSRSRLIDVLDRCSQSDIRVDETMGGAGLGLWRIFSNAVTVAVSVIEPRSTEILVCIAKRTVARPYACHLFFTKSKTKRRNKPLPDDSEKPAVNESITIVTK